jgi:PAS domain S-box-containing protein
VHPALPPATFAFVVVAVLAAYVGLRRHKTPLHWYLLAMLGSLMLWSGAVVFRYSATTHEGLMWSFRVMFAGVYLAPPLWLLVAAGFARARIFEDRRWIYPLILLPSILAYLSFLTNDAHHLFAGEISLQTFSYGPLFWVFAATSYACVLTGVWLYLRHARRMLANRERIRGVLLAVAALVPVLANAMYLSEIVPWEYDPTSPSFAISVLLIFEAIFRYRLLGALPLVRRDVIEHLRDGVGIAGADGLILDLNPAAAALLGRAAGELRGLALADAILDLVPAPDREAFRRYLEAPGGGPNSGTVAFQTADGRDLEVSGGSVQGRRGEPAGQFFVLRDRTEERRFERFVRQSQKLETVGGLVAGVAHEANNPLSFIRANLNHVRGLAEIATSRLEAYAAKDAEDLAELPQIVDETAEGIERITHLVDRMCRLSEKAGQELEWVDLNAVLREALEIAEFHHNDAVRVELRLEEGLPPLRGSRECLGQAILNLLLNAKQALGDSQGTCIVASTCREGDSAVIRVVDDGPGMPREIQERIFDPFFTTKRPGEGTGLGLSIAFDIVREHGGVLEVVSRPGSGASFTIRLPLEPKSIPG